MRRDIYERKVKEALVMYEKAGIVLTEEEKRSVEVVDWNIGEVDTLGLQLITYVNTARVCAKEMVLLPYQTCAEHKHVPTNGEQAKEETFRCRFGKVYLYVEGEGKKENMQARDPAMVTTVFHEIVLHPGEQYTILPEVWHWFQAGEEGAVISEFSTRSTDETDQFTDPRFTREVRIED